MEITKQYTKASCSFRRILLMPSVKFRINFNVSYITR
jgi:hypothetical protein